MRRDALRAVIGAAFVVATLVVAAHALPAQSASANTSVNLRRDPSTRHRRIALLAEGTDLSLVSPDTTNGFLHVRVVDTGRRGWAWAAAVDIAADDTTTAVVDTTSRRDPTIHHDSTARPDTTARISTGITPATDPALFPAAAAPAAYNNCPLTGDPSPNGSKYAEITALNQDKNRYTSPAPADVDTTVTLERMLAPGDDRARFDQSRAAVVEGYVVDAKVGGIETTNCRTTDPPHRDTHIEVGLSPNAPPRERVIVEVTPRWRAQLQGVGTDWSTPALQTLLTGKRVRFRGWLLYDKEHEQQAEHTSPGGATNWRATVWELHPVTGIEVLPH